MYFKVRNNKSSGRHLRGGAPQGKLLGNFLFILTTDCLEDREDVLSLLPGVSDNTSPVKPEVPLDHLNDPSISGSKNTNSASSSLGRGDMDLA